MEVVIRPKNKWWLIDWHEIWSFRDLFYFLTWRDIKVRYKQTTIGIIWAILQPFLTMVVFSVFFGKLAKMPSDGLPYPIFVYTGLIFWTLFNSGLSHASNSFVENEKIITKIYFPRLMLPISAIITNIIDFLIASVILFGLMAYYGYLPSLTGILLFPVLTLMTIATAIGLGLLFASINVKYRDVRYVLPFFIQLLLFVTPVIYPVSVLGGKWHWLFGLNPMAGIIDAARAGILGTRPVDWSLLGLSLIFIVVFGCVGFFYFRKTERYFADVI